MKKYLYNLINRLKEHSKTLDLQEMFVDIPWVIIDENLNQQKYIFKRNGDLILSLNGKVRMGKWEYIPSAKSMLIDRIEDKILLNQMFVDSAVMILNLDGNKEDNLILANEILIPDLDVLNYLKRMFYTNNRIRTVKLENGNSLEIHNYEFEYYLNNLTVSIDQESIKDGKYKLMESAVKLNIENSIIKNVFVDREYNTKQGILIIEEDRNAGKRKGNYVYLNNELAPDGKYKLGTFSSIRVKNGQIV